MRPQDESVLAELGASGAVRLAELGPPPYSSDAVSRRLLDWVAEGRPRSLFYLFCRMNSGTARRIACETIDARALPFDPDEVVADVFSRLFTLLSEKAALEEPDLSAWLATLTQAVLAQAVEDLLAYVPGAGLEVPGHRVICQSAEAASESVRSHKRRVHLSPEEYQALIAQTTLKLSRLDRRLLLRQEPAALIAAVGGAADSLSRGAAHRRLHEELVRSLQWLDLEFELLEQSKNRYRRRAP